MKEHSPSSRSWTLFVDTDSIYQEMRDRFGDKARMDYMELPAMLLRHSGISQFVEMYALVLRYGKSWRHFSDSLKRFGYNVVFTDRGVQPMTLAIEVSRLASEVEGIVLVTASRRIGPIVEQLLFNGNGLRIASFFSEIEMGGVEKIAPGLILMDETWLWSGNQTPIVEV